MDFRPFILATLPAVRLLAAEPTAEQAAFYTDKVLLCSR